MLTLDDGAGSAIRASLIGAVPARIEGADPLAGHSNYIIGDDPRRWQIGIPQFGKFATAESIRHRFAVLRQSATAWIRLHRLAAPSSVGNQARDRRRAVGQPRL